MTKQEALELERSCDEKMSSYLNEDCEMSLALTGKLKISFDNGFFTLNTKKYSVCYVKYMGDYADLLEKIDQAITCIKENREEFDKLIWSYEHIRDLDEDFFED